MTKGETKELGMETHPGEGVMKEEKFPNSRKPSHQWAKRRSSPGPLACHQGTGAGQGGTGRMLRISTRPECSENNLRELT